MKIAFINTYQNRVNRGAETFVKELASRLSKNHEVDILTSVKFKKRYDVIIPTNGRSQVLLVRLITWLSGAKMVVSGQSGNGLDDRINLYSFPNAFIALSQKALGWAKGVNPFVRVVKIPNGVDLSKFQANKVKSREGDKVILSVGAFTNEKRHDLTIKAVSKLTRVNLVIVGGGGNKRVEIENLGRKLLGDRFQTLSVSNEEISSIYKKADIFAFPTVSWESFGIAVLEAMASNLPVVANNDPIRREIVGEAGLLVDPTDTNVYASALTEALKTDWGSKPRKQAEKFNWDNIALQYEELFKEIVK